MTAQVRNRYGKGVIAADIVQGLVYCRTVRLAGSAAQQNIKDQICLRHPQTIAAFRQLVQAQQTVVHSLRKSVRQLARKGIQLVEAARAVAYGVDKT